MCTNDSNSGRGSKTSSPLCLPSNNRLRRDECALGIHQNTTGELSAEQKAANKVLSQVRIFVEHAIGGMKHYNILVHAFRNRIKNFEDDVIGVCAGLWNLVLSY